MNEYTYKCGETGEQIICPVCNAPATKRALAAGSKEPVRIPREPTQAMLDNARLLFIPTDSTVEECDAMRAEIWRAMYAAAPLSEHPVRDEPVHRHWFLLAAKIVRQHRMSDSSGPAAMVNGALEDAALGLERRASDKRYTLPPPHADPPLEEQE